jgi:hypothetical protein
MAKFRETLWFKLGEELESDKVPLPVEDRYLDDGSVSDVDSAAFGLHTGATRPIGIVHAASERRTKRIDRA